jgi:hypothetical protein
MDTHDFTDKLQRAYHSMVDMINISVEVEEKSVDEAFDIAKEKMSQWEELTSHEVEKISTEIKLDLTSLVETLAEAKHAYGEQLSLDTLYLKERSLEKLTQIADKTTLELAEFKRNLEEKVQVATEEQSEHDHHQHQQWDSEHAMWLDDIAMWQKEHEKMQDTLYAIQDRIQQHGMAIDKHAEKIRAHQVEEHRHEVVMAAAEQDKNITDKQLTESQHSHERMKGTHNKQAKLHQKIKQHHKDVMVLLTKLHKQLN